MPTVRASPLLLWILAAAASAQDLPVAEREIDHGETICIGGPDWYPTLADVHNISSTPVPARYREIFESTDGCARFGLDVGRLIDWHIGFGSMNTIVPALAYMEAEFAKVAPRPHAYARTLERTGQAAIEQLRAAEGRQGPQPTQPDRASPSESVAMRRFLFLANGRDSYLFLAEQNLRAAEEFASMRLLSRAEQYLNAVLEGDRFLQSLGSLPPADALPIPHLDNFRIDDLAMRVAVLRAFMSRSPVQIVRAEAVVQSFHRPTYRRAAEAAFSGGEDFCEISEPASGADNVEAACRTENFHERVVSYWLNRASLDILVGPSSESAELAIRLLQFDQLPDRGRCCRIRAEEDLLRLRLRQAASHRRAFLAPADGEDEHDRLEHWDEALRALTDAERLISAFTAPSRFRRIAEAWLELWRQGIPVGEGAERSDPRDDPQRRAYATYLRRLLINLDAIAVGADPGL